MLVEVDQRNIVKINRKSSNILKKKGWSFKYYSMLLYINLDIGRVNFDHRAKLNHICRELLDGVI